MTSLEDIQKSYKRKYKLHETKETNLSNKIKSYEKRIEKLKTKKDHLTFPSWVDVYLNDIAKELLKFFPGRYYEILGPFGMNAHTAIHFYKKGIADNEKFTVDSNCVSITFTPIELKNGELKIVDENVDTKQYPEGSLAEVNGSNHPTIEMPKTIKELSKWVR